MSLGSGYTCATDRLTLQCWGRNDRGQTARPAALSHATTHAASTWHSCAINTDMSMHCLGDNA